MALDVKINISTVTHVGNVGFGYPLILEENATAEQEYTVISGLSDLLKIGGDTPKYTVKSDVYKVAQLMFMQEHAPEKIAVCSTASAATAWLAAEVNVSKEWRQLVVVNGGETATAVSTIMTAIEAQTTYKKFFYANVAKDDTTKFTTTGIKRTLLCYYTPTDDIPVPVAALVGAVSGLEVGSYTLNNMIVKGIEGLDLSDAEIEEIHNKGGITFVISAGDVVASEGMTAGGEWVDSVDGDDWIEQQLKYKTQKVFNNNLKVPYTNVGISMLEGAATEVMTEAKNKGIADSFTVAYKLREDTSEAERAARKYFGGNIKYERAGAIHEIEINAEASV